MSFGEDFQGLHCCHRCQAALERLERLSPVPVWCSPSRLEGRSKATIQTQEGEEEDGDQGGQSQERERVPHLAEHFSNLFRKHLLSTYCVLGPVLETQPWASRCPQDDDRERLISGAEIRVPWEPRGGFWPSIGEYEVRKGLLGRGSI